MKAWWRRMRGCGHPIGHVFRSAEEQGKGFRLWQMRCNRCESRWWTLAPTQTHGGPDE